MIKYSIIVPIYNIEDYIEECILSVVNQSYNNFELILVDDGTPDNSGAICDAYEKKYKNIRVVHKKNGGLSDARNAGLKISKGEYILFLDGDDTLCSNCLEMIDSQIKNKKIDILSCDFCIYGKNAKDEEIFTKKINSLEDYVTLLKDIPWSAWRNVYRREIFVRNQLEYKKGLIGAEDCEFFIRFFEKTKEIYYSNINIVNYRLNRDGSITNKMSYKAIVGELDVFSNYFYKFYKLNKPVIYRLFANKYLNTITTIDSLENCEEINSVVEHINNNKEIFKYSQGFKYSLAKFFWKLLGYRNGTKLIRKIK